MSFGPGGMMIFLVTMGLTAFAQFKVKSAYAKYSQIRVQSGVTGADVARAMMRAENITDVALERIPGEMTDHFDPQAKVVRLSDAVYNGQSIAAVGIAAHEVGHVIQDARGYSPMKLRHVIYPVTSIGSKLAVPLIIAGVILQQVPWLLWAGILLFATSTVFTLVTLPVEFDASRRALAALKVGGVMRDDEYSGAKRVLTAAALTYVAAAAASVLYLLHYIMLAQRRN